MSTQVDVSVDSSGKITVEPTDLDVGETKGAVNITWSMLTSGWEVTDISNLPSPEFSEKAKNGNTGYKIKDKNDDTKTYRYSISVGHTDGRTLTHRDPTIKNGGRGG